jgi:hypothetical protein
MESNTVLGNILRYRTIQILIEGRGGGRPPPDATEEVRIK